MLAGGCPCRRRRNLPTRRQTRPPGPGHAEKPSDPLRKSACAAARARVVAGETFRLAVKLGLAGLEVP